MERQRAFKFELQENGEQRRQMRRYAGSLHFVYNHALALQKEMYERTGKSHTRFQLDRLLTLWKQEKAWLSETPAHALQQALVDLDRAYRNFFQKRADFPKFKKKGQRTAYRESDAQCITLDQPNRRIRLPKRLRCNDALERRRNPRAFRPGRRSRNELARTRLSLVVASQPKSI